MYKTNIHSCCFWGWGNIRRI